MQGTTVLAIEVKATDFVVGVCRDRVRLISSSVANREIPFLSVKYLEELGLVVSSVGSDVFLTRVRQQLTAINGDGSQY